MLKKNQHVTRLLLQDVFKLQAAMLRECTSYKPSTAAVQATLKWAFTDMEETAARQTAFSLLRVCDRYSSRVEGQDNLRRTRVTCGRV